MHNKKILTTNQILEMETNIKIKTNISEESKNAFKDTINNKTKFQSKDIKFILITLFFQIGKPDKEKNSNVLHYQNKDNVTINLQFKVKNYIPFKSYEGANKYIENELTSEDMYFLLEVEDGKVIYEF